MLLGMWLNNFLCEEAEGRRDNGGLRQTGVWKHDFTFEMMEPKLFSESHPWGKC